MEKGKFSRIRVVAVYAAAVLLVFSAIAFAKGKMSLSAKLSGASEEPPVTTSATGNARFFINTKTGEIRYVLHVKDLKDVTMAHIHLGAKGESGPPVAMLFMGPEKKGVFSGILARGTITKKDLMGRLKGKTVKDLAHEMETGGTYVNIHTKANPGGELRGQIERRK